MRPCDSGLRGQRSIGATARATSLDRATEAGGRHSRGHLDFLVKVVRLEEILAALASGPERLGNPPATP
ncbi:MAG TPA: hypothetical protein VLX59_16000 [Acidimicrobiales bacterium]|nr:hypothetical protein [Acidimicrobiales bacterium]